MTRFLLLSLLVLSGFTTRVSAALAAPAGTIAQERTITRANLEAELGRKLTFKERLAVGVVKRQQQRSLRRSVKARTGQEEPRNGMAVAGFVCGILGLVMLGPIAGVPAIIFSAIGMSRANKYGLPKRGLAVAGLVMGIVSVAGFILVALILTLAWSI